MICKLKKNVLIIGAGAVAHVAAHKCAQHNDILGNICIASRTQSKCDAIIESVRRKNSLKDQTNKIYSRQVDALNIPETVQLIKDTNSEIVINLGQSYINMSVLEACIQAGVAYLDTAIHEEPDKVCENPPWYANYEWKKLEACKQAGITAILGIGFDPGVVNSWCQLAQAEYFDKIETIDILDVNAGSHGKYFATNFDPEINFREFKKVWTWQDKKWVQQKVHSIRVDYDFPIVGTCPVYLNGHDEIHSLSKNIDAQSIRFWMGFGDHYLNVFNVLNNIDLISEKPVQVGDQEVVPLKLLKALLPDPASLAPNYTGKTCIGNYIKGTKDGKERSIFIYNSCDHAECYKEVESQAISYTAGVPVTAAAILIAQGVWDVKHMANVEELDAKPFINLLDKIGLPTQIVENPKPFICPPFEHIEHID